MASTNEVSARSEDPRVKVSVRTKVYKKCYTSRKCTIDQLYKNCEGGVQKLLGSTFMHSDYNILY